MDFFKSQDKARKSTNYLVFLFCCAVLALVLLINTVIIATTWGIDEKVVNQHKHTVQAAGQGYLTETSNLLNYIDWTQFFLVSLAVIAVIGLASLYKLISLSRGGKVVAEALGGRLVLPNTTDPTQRRLLNVVEEMAIAAGMPVPAVYLLEEDGINAFAAGYSSKDAVLGVTRGCVETLSREQLQGVIGHEFSHVLNGDMRLNIRLIAVLFGILFVGHVGRILMNSTSSRHHYRSSRSNNQNSLALLGLGLMIIGYVGSFFGGLIKAAVSRQREYLADASSVQFTRNPAAIAEALKVIGGYKPSTVISNSHAEEMSHLFFGQALVKMNSMFATHPPLSERILRLQPNWNGKFTVTEKKVASKLGDSAAMTGFVGGNDAGGRDNNELSETQDASVRESRPKKDAIKHGSIASAIGNMNTAINANTGRNLLSEIPEELQTIARDPWGARALIYALLFNEETEIREKQLTLVKEGSDQPLFEYLSTVLLQLTALKQAMLKKTMLNQTMLNQTMLNQTTLIQTTLNQTTFANRHRLVLIDLCVPTLKNLSKAQYANFKSVMKRLIEADKRVDVSEWCLFTLLNQYLNAAYGKIVRPKEKYSNLKQVRPAMQIMFSLIARKGHQDEKEAEIAYNKAANAVSLYNERLLPASDCSLEKFSQSVSQLSQCYPLLKPRLLKAIAMCIEHDGEVTTVEMELLQVVSVILDCPIPLYTQ